MPRTELRSRSELHYERVKQVIENLRHQPATIDAPLLLFERIGDSCTAFDYAHLHHFELLNDDTVIELHFSAHSVRLTGQKLKDLYQQIAERHILAIQDFHPSGDNFVDSISIRPYGTQWTD